MDTLNKIEEHVAREVPLTLMQRDLLNVWQLHVIVATQATEQAAPCRFCVEGQLT